jgi:hypothetical protein
MSKAVSLALLAAGILLIVFGVMASTSFSSDISRFFTVHLSAGRAVHGISSSSRRRRAGATQRREPWKSSAPTA